MHRFVYWASCVDLNGELVNYVRYDARPRRVSYDTFARRVDLAPLRREGHPAMYRVSAPDNWSISFWQSHLPNGAPVYYFAWSGIEHFFVDRFSAPPDVEALTELVSGESQENPSDELPALVSNLLLVRINAGAELLPEYLYYALFYLYDQGFFAQLAGGACQQSIRAKDVAAIRVEGGRTLGDLVTIKTRFKEEDLAPGDILIQRVGSRGTCGRVSIVLKIDPLSVRTQNPAGGLAAGRHPGEFDREQLAAGTKVELEHTSDPQIARKIAMDHLVEHPDYYKALAAMEAKLEEGRRAGNPWIGNPKSESPDASDWNFYINFVLYAVVGSMGHADLLLTAHRDAILRAAAAMRARGPMPTGTLFRGLLLEPHLVRNKEVKRDDDRRFLSFSQSADVACWFAHPQSVISSFVSTHRPEVAPYLTTLDGKKVADRVLWHHAWRAVPMGDGRGLPFVDAARFHPDVDAGQFAWNLETQAEVIVLPGTTKKIKVRKVGPDDCPEVDELDARYTYPPFLGEYISNPSRMPPGFGSFDADEVFGTGSEAVAKPLSESSRVLRDLARGDVVTVGRMRFVVMRPVGSLQALVYKHPSKHVKLYELHAGGSTSEDEDTVVVFQVGGSGQRVGEDVASGPLRATNERLDL